MENYKKQNTVKIVIILINISGIFCIYDNIVPLTDLIKLFLFNHELLLIFLHNKKNIAILAHHQNMRRNILKYGNNETKNKNQKTTNKQYQ